LVGEGEGGGETKRRLRGGREGGEKNME